MHVLPVAVSPPHDAGAARAKYPFMTSSHEKIAAEVAHGHVLDAKAVHAVHAVHALAAGPVMVDDCGRLMAPWLFITRKA